VDQVLLGSHDVVLVFKLADVLAFYGNTLNTLLRDTSTLARAISSSRDGAWKRFYDILKTQSNHLLQSAGPYPSDLKPSRYVTDTLSRLVRPML
jgi:hypothetical protein